MALSLPVPQYFYDDVKTLVAEDDKLNRAILGLSERTQNAWAALRSIASGEINDDDSMKAALADIRSERNDDVRLREFYRKHREIMDTLSPPKRGIGSWLIGG